MKKKDIFLKAGKLESKRCLPCYLFYSSFDLASSPKVKTNLWPIRRVLLCNVPGIPGPNFLFLSQMKSSQKTPAPQTYLREEWSEPCSPSSSAMWAGRQTRESAPHPCCCQGPGGTQESWLPWPGTQDPPAPLCLPQGSISASAEDVQECLKGELGVSWILALSLGETTPAGKHKEGEWPNVPELELWALPSAPVKGVSLFHLSV